eukprot:18416-Heterococcus_DN1.PRE.2
MARCDKTVVLMATFSDPKQSVARIKTDAGSAAIQSNQWEVRINTDAERSAIESSHEVYIIDRETVVGKQDSIDCTKVQTFSQKGTQAGATPRTGLHKLSVLLSQ